MADTVDALVHATRGYVVAPAGYGKTEAVARAIAADPDRRHLVLTHTHAGVHALTERLRKHGISRRSVRVSTIAGFALKYASSYPATSALPTTEPTTSADWIDVHAAAHRLLTKTPLAPILRASYDTVFVDEYQDCTRGQHTIVLAIAEVLPVRILGDPLQGIFSFAARDGDPIVSWTDDVFPHFDELPPLQEPQRWLRTNPALGEWLHDARQRLIDGVRLVPDPAVVTVVPLAEGAAINECRQIARAEGTVAAITDQPARAHYTAKHLGGQYGCMEPMWAPDLISAAKKIDVRDGPARALAALEFTATCMSNSSGPLKTARERLSKGTVPRPRAGADNARAVEAVVGVAMKDHPGAILEALEAIADLKDVRIYRNELLHEMRRALRHAATHPDRSLATCAWEVREQTRQRGRAARRLTVTRPLLAKGLEFDRVIALDVGSLTDPRDLYVTITRASRQLVLLGELADIPPYPEAAPAASSSTTTGE